MKRALIVSLGGSPEPVVVCIRHFHPSYVCFFASQQSVDLVAKVKADAALEFDDEKVLAEAPEDLIACYEAALRCFDRAERRGYGPQHRIVDVTGGTKAMSSALALAATARGATKFSYVGGARRDKAGLGVVESGFERIRESESPWKIFGIEEKKRIAQFFNAHQYDGAAQALDDLLPRLDPPQRALLEPLRDAALGYADWDRFHHGATVEHLTQAKKKLVERLSPFKPSEHKNLRAFLAGLEPSLAILQQLQNKTRGFKHLDALTAADLVANAARRIEEGKFDDAVARLYRAVEMLGQCEFQSRFKAPTGKVTADKLPDSLREEFSTRYRSRAGDYLQLPLYATYRALEAAGSEIGTRFLADEELKKLLSARNDSPLAHGITPASLETATKFKEIVAGLLPEGSEVVEFPKLDL